MVGYTDASAVARGVFVELVGAGSGGVSFAVDASVVAAHTGVSIGETGGTGSIFPWSGGI